MRHPINLRLSKIFVKQAPEAVRPPESPLLRERPFRGALNAPHPQSVPPPDRGRLGGGDVLAPLAMLAHQAVSQKSYPPRLGRVKSPEVRFLAHISNLSLPLTGGG